jgi:hypothetical protein
MTSFDSTIHSTPQGNWGRKYAPPRPTVVLTLDQNGHPEISDARSRGGFYPYLQKGGVMFSSPKGILIDVSA